MAWIDLDKAVMKSSGVYVYPWEHKRINVTLTNIMIDTYDRSISIKYKELVCWKTITMNKNNHMTSS